MVITLGVVKLHTYTCRPVFCMTLLYLQVTDRMTAQPFQASISVSVLETNTSCNFAQSRQEVT